MGEKLSKLDKEIVFDEKEEDDTISEDYFTEQENFDDVNSFEKINKNYNNLEDHSCASEQLQEEHCRFRVKKFENPENSANHEKNTRKQQKNFHEIWSRPVYIPVL